MELSKLKFQENLIFIKWIYQFLNPLKVVNPNTNIFIERLKAIRKRYEQPLYLKEETDEQRKQIYECFLEKSWSQILKLLQQYKFDIFEQHFIPKYIKKQDLFSFCWTNLGMV